jgi:excisionase family DNA binding protein
MSDYITTGEAARLMGVGRESVRRYVDNGLLDAIKTPGGQRRIKRVSVQKVVESRRPHAPNVTIIGGA